MRRFELVEGKSSKFWEIERVGDRITTRWGRIGTVGQSKEKVLGAAEKAEREVDKQVRSKVGKGYAEVAASALTVPASASESESESESESASASASESESEPASGAGASTARRPPVGVGDEDTLVLPPSWSRRVLARRGGHFRASPPRTSAASAWAAVRAHFSLYRGLWAAKAKFGLPIQATAAEWLAMEAPNPLVPHDPELAAAIVRMVCARVRDGEPPHAAVVAWLVRGGSLEQAVRAVLGSYRFDVENFQVIPGPARGWAPIYASVRHDLGPLAGLRAAIAAADDVDYLAARDAAAAMRETAEPVEECAAAFLFPTESGWCEEADARASGLGSPYLIDAVSDPDLGRDLARRLGPWQVVGNAYQGVGHLATLVDALGVDVLPILHDALAIGGIDASGMQRLVEVLTILPSDAAMLTLVERVDEKYFLAGLTEAMDRFPRRAVRVIAPRLLATGKPRERARALMTTLLRKAPDVVADAVGGLGPDVRAAVDALSAAQPSVAEAAAEDVPAFLTSPPWSRKTKRAKPKTVADVAPLAFEPSMAWAAGERERWASTSAVLSYRSHPFATFDDARHEAFVARVATRAERDHDVMTYIREVEPTWARRALAVFHPRDDYHGPEQLPPIAAQYELDALGAINRFAETRARHAVPLFGPFRVAELAIRAARAMRLKSVRGAATAWLARHPEAAAVGLVPHAVGADRKLRAAAEEAIGYLVFGGHRDTLADVAARYGADVSEAVAPLLDFDPLDTYPNKLPTLPSFFDAAVLTPLVLRHDRGALPRAAVETFGVMLAFSPPEAPYGGVERLIEACDPASLGAFAWGLFESWLAAGAPSKESWAFTAMGWLGDDECARRLTPKVREWPGEAAHTRAVLGLEVLARIGSDVALMHLHGIAQKLKFKGLKKAAGEKIAQIAEARGLTKEQLADRLVPDLGLDERGSMRLDFGPRAFTVGFDENLAPFVLDETGARLETLPKPGKKDDAALGAEASAQWKALRKDARTVAKQQLLRVESAMSTRRRWSAEAFRLFFVEHPLVVHVVRRLVWGVYENDTLTATFRVAEDSTFADVDDEPLALDGGAVVGVPHALELGDELSERWGAVLADYEIIQPFRQLGRAVHARSDGEADRTTLDRVKGRVVDPGKILGLESRGWERGAVEDGAWYWIEKPVGGDVRAMLVFEPGIIVGLPHELGDQTLGSVTLVKGPGGWWQGGERGELAFGAISEVAFSELVTDLTALAG